MRYTFLSAHSLLGISHPKSDADAVLFSRQTGDLRVTLTSNPERHLQLPARGRALLGLMARGQLTAPIDPEAHAVLEAETAKALGRLCKLIGTNPLLLIQIDGEVDGTLPDSAREIFDFILCFDAIDKRTLKSSLQPQVSAILAAIRIGCTEEVSIDNICEAILLVSESGKIVHSVSMEALAPDVYVSRRLGEDPRQSIAAAIESSLKATALSRVMQLHAYSLVTRHDNYRAFLAAWAALEILVGKLFPLYRERLVADMLAITSSPGLRAYLDRIAAVMNDKHSLTDRFAVLSVYLDQTKAETEISEFRRLKKYRDNLSHGMEVDDKELPTKDVQKLFDKYLRNHFAVTPN